MYISGCIIPCGLILAFSFHLDLHAVVRNAYIWMEGKFHESTFILTIPFTHPISY